jgi:sterol desaturase/sphingolipid hydroxylase (fatty acid hydroxylase superfamily)
MSFESLQLLCTSILVASVPALCLAERFFPYRPEQRFFRRGLWTDFAIYSLLQGYLLGLFVAYLLRFLEPLAQLTVPVRLTNWPIWAQVSLFVVWHDLWLYWFHRWQHSSPLLWRTHEPHHTNTEVDWVAGSRASPLEILITEAFKYAPIALLGAPPEVALIRGTFDAVWGMYIHSNIAVRSGLLRYVINGPELHRWHHALDIEAQNKNLGTKFALWDWLFGTAYCPVDRRPAGYGLSEGEPQGYLSQQLFSLRPLPPRLAARVKFYAASGTGVNVA